MRKVLISLCLVLTGLGAPVLAQAVTTPHYDLLFRTGTLDDVSQDAQLAYTRTVINSLAPETENRDTGRIELTLTGKDPVLAYLRFTQGEKHRTLGKFPASVGNPIILYFVETVARDMAETAGGSPFYIRNRIKDSLVNPAEMKTGEVSFAGQGVSVHEVVLRPFEGDPNGDRMKGFEHLALEVTMSDDVPGWYHTLRAYVPGSDGTPVYSSTLSFDGQGAAQ